MMKRREFVKLTAAGTLSAALPDLRAQEKVMPPNTSPPNVVYVFSDTHRWCSMSFTETPLAITPSMAAMRTNGVSFSNCYSTLPICSPYRAILMTGRWPWQQGFIANHMALEDRPDVATAQHATLGWMFKDAGYATHYVGKWHLGNGRRAPDYGFQTATLWGNEDHADLSYVAVGADNPFGAGRKRWDKDPRYSGVPGDTTFPYKIVGETDHALTLIDQHVETAPNRPLFLMLSLQDPHGPLRKKGKPLAPPHIRAKYSAQSPIPCRDNDLRKDATFMQDYHEAVTAVDEQLGRIRARLQEAGIADNTILIYSSDHGGLGGAQGLGGGQKRWPHDESSRVPFLVEWPGGVARGKRARDIDALFATIDIFPTVCHLAGLGPLLRAHQADDSLAYLNACPGVDHSKNVTGEVGAPDPASVFVCHPSNMNNKSDACPVQRTVITGDYMYSVKAKTRLGHRDEWRKWDEQGEREWCLYDRRKDPHQLHNLISDPRLENAKRTLRLKLAAWLAKAETPFVKHWFGTHPHAANWRKEHDGKGIEDAFDLWSYVPQPAEAEPN